MGDTGGATETMIIKQNGRGQTIDRRAHGTNNKPCAQHTETSGGRPGHFSRPVTTRGLYHEAGFNFTFG